MTSRAVGSETAPAEDVRQGNVDRYSVVRAVAGSAGALMYEVLSLAEQEIMMLLEVDALVISKAFDPATTLRSPTELEKTVVLSARDQGTHEETPFLVFDLREAFALSAGTYYGWDPLRLELLGRLVGTLRTARDNRLDIACCAYETLAGMVPRQVRFMSPVRTVPPDEDVDFEKRYFMAFQMMLPKIVRNNFITAPPTEEDLVSNAPEGANPLMWSVQMYASPELRELLDDIVSSRIDSLDSAQQAIDSFGAGQIVRKRTGWGTHRGLVREGNEDALMLLEQTMVAGSRPIRMELYAVADGMGGHEAGEIASEITLKSMAIEIVGGLNLTTARELGRDLLDHEFLCERMVRAIERTNHTVRQYAWDAHSGSRRKPGSTLVCALAIGAVLTVGHVGDSRAYKIGQDGSLQRITRDHSPVQKLVDHNKLTAEQAFSHPHRHQISSNIGISPELLKRDVNIRLLREGEGVMMCSDGLCDMLQDADIEELSKKERDPRRLARTMVEAACERGGHDNVTVLVVMRAPGPPQEQRENPSNVTWQSERIGR